ncbi:MAG: thioredoxin domain-containing protein [Candidatus Saccharimonadaceae bacterium]|nr:thioredoxin domain-containing protein [Candidatus Saccharimonadaceae bacterium]
MKSTNKANFNADVLGSKKVVLVDIWASWCGPCRAMEPIIEQIEEETSDWADVVKLNAVGEMELAQELGASGLPTFLVFKDGKAVNGSSGMTTKANLLKMMSDAR